MTLAQLTPILAENSLFHTIGEIFHPIFVAFATVLAFFYGLIPNYVVAIALLTIVIMALLTPLTVKSTKSMIQMQRLQPEIKRLQQKYKGAENREQLQRELMRVYKENGVSPAGGCIPLLLQMPFLIVLYDIIRGLTNTVMVHGHVVAQPRYIPTDSKMYHDLVANHGAMYAFGMNLALKPFSHHSSTAAAIPYFALVAIAVVLQYIQMRQMNSRNPQAAQANPQMQTIQKITPLIFAYIYFLIPAAVVIYMIVSTMIRIGTQDVMFRMGIVQPPGERAIPPARDKTGRGRSIIDAASSVLGRGGPSERGPTGSNGWDSGAGKQKPSTSAGNGSGTQKGTPKGSGAGGELASGAKTTGSRPSGSNRPRPSGAGSNRRPPAKGANAGGNGAAPKQHPRAKDKRERKAR
jgi:YidC/Oxa1 family membrane protein insertase